MADPERKWWYFTCDKHPNEHTDCCIRLVDMPEDCPACGATISIYEMPEDMVETEECEGGAQ